MGRNFSFKRELNDTEKSDFKKNLKLQWKCYRPAVLVSISLIVALLLILLGNNPWTQGKFIENAMSPEKLLMGYYRWGCLRIFLLFAATALVMAFSIYAIVFIFTNKILSFGKSTTLSWKDQAMVKGQTVQMVIVCIELILFMNYAYFTGENPFNKMKMFAQECKEIQAGNFETAEVYLHPEHYEKDSLWGFSDSTNGRFTSYMAMGDGFSWNKIYVPDYIAFELDAANPYDEWQNANWNEENAARYKITYTPNLMVVVKIETLPPNGPIERISEFSDEISAKGYTKNTTDKDDKNWQHNVSHIEFATGSVMDFYWEGPITLGNQYGSTDKMFVYKDPELTWRYELRACVSDYYDGIINDASSMTKEQWLAKSGVSNSTGYFQAAGDEDTFEVILAVENEEAQGYCYYLIDVKHEIFYQFSYVENINVYDDNRAKRVINSIKYVE